MLFKSSFHDDLRRGVIRRSYRRWSSPKVRQGGRYRFAVGDALEIDRLTRVPWGDVTDAEARKVGFRDRQALATELERSGRGSLTDDEELFRVDFHYVADEGPAAPQADPEDVVAELDGLEARSRGGPWAWRTLEWIDANPRRRAADLAAALDAEVRPLKAKVRRLKALGLTRSHEVGYETTALGRAVLERRSRQSG